MLTAAQQHEEEVEEEALHSGNRSSVCLLLSPLLFLRQPNEPNGSPTQLMLSRAEMADDEMDYNIVFPDAGTSGEHHPSPNPR